VVDVSQSVSQNGIRLEVFHRLFHGQIGLACSIPHCQLAQLGFERGKPA
jgi:hypothetical protein